MLRFGNSFPALMSSILAAFVLMSLAVAVIIFLPQPAEHAASQAGDPRFLWGVNIGAYGLHQPNQLYEPSLVDKQVSDLKELGVNSVRAGIEIDAAGDLKTQVNDDWLGKLEAAGLTIVGSIEPKIFENLDPNTDYEAYGYELGAAIAARYGSILDYYQLMNEVTGVVWRKDTDQGPILPSLLPHVAYDQTRYRVLVTLLRGLGRGIREHDPTAQIVLTGHAMSYDVMEFLLRDGIDFDIVGWAWYSDDGNDVTARDYNYGDYLNFAQELTKLGKDLWIIESNYAHGSFASFGESPEIVQNAQAGWLEHFARHIYDTGYFHGFFVYQLYDDPYMAAARDQAWGIMAVDGTGQINPKPAFTAYQHIIEQKMYAEQSARPD